jgi:hypothetical protein
MGIGKELAQGLGRDPPGATDLARADLPLAAKPEDRAHRSAEQARGLFGRVRRRGAGAGAELLSHRGPDERGELFDREGRRKLHGRE